VKPFSSLLAVVERVDFAVVFPVDDFFRAAMVRASLSWVRATRNLRDERIQLRARRAATQLLLWRAP
jgi:hypothetical protein